MKLLFISNLYPPLGIGGLEDLCQEVVEGLLNRGHSVQVLTSDHGLENNGLLSDGPVLRKLKLQADITRYRPSVFFREYERKKRHNRMALESAINSHKPDLIVVFGMWNLSSQVPYEANLLLPGRVVCYMASTWALDHDTDASYWRLPARHRAMEALKLPLRWIALRKLERDRPAEPNWLGNVICCSQFLKDLIVDSGGIASNVDVIHCGIDPDPFICVSRGVGLLGRKTLGMIYTGALLPHKGVHTAIEALALARSKLAIVELSLTIVGSGSAQYTNRLRQTAVSLGLGNSVSFAGRVPRSDIPNLLRDHDIFLFTSIGPEAMARSVMEAMAAGLLVVGAEAGGQKEMLRHGRNALTYEPGNASMLADRIVEAWTDPRQAKRLARSGQDLIKSNFTLDRMLDQLEKYLSVVNER